MAKATSQRTRKLLNGMIVALLFSIFIFLYIGKIFQQKAERAQQTGQLIRIDYGERAIIFAQQKWQLVPADRGIDANQVAARWQQVMQATATLHPGRAGYGQHVLLYFAATPEPLVVKLGLDQEQRPVLEFVARGQLMPLPQELYRELSLEPR